MSVTPETADDLIVIGKIYSIHGVRGEVKVYSFTDPIDNLLDYKKLTLRRGNDVRQAELVSGRSHNGKFLVVEVNADSYSFELNIGIASSK